MKIAPVLKREDEITQQVCIHPRRAVTSTHTPQSEMFVSRDICTSLSGETCVPAMSCTRRNSLAGASFFVFLGPIIGDANPGKLSV